MAENTNIETEKTTQTEPEKKTEPAAPSLEDLAASIKALQAALEKQKKATDNASSDAAAWKKKYNANGDMDTVFNSIGQLIQTVKTKTVTDALSRQPGLSTGTPPTTNTVNDDEEDKIRKWAGLPPKRRI